MCVSGKQFLFLQDTSCRSITSMDDAHTVEGSVFTVFCQFQKEAVECRRKQLNLWLSLGLTVRQ